MSFGKRRLECPEEDENGLCTKTYDSLYFPGVSIQECEYKCNNDQSCLQFDYSLSARECYTANAISPIKCKGEYYETWEDPCYWGDGWTVIKYTCTQPGYSKNVVTKLKEAGTSKSGECHD